jgi:DNA polymerase III subunit epsilon
MNARRLMGEPFSGLGPHITTPLRKNAAVHHLVFNPGTENHRDAERIHGFSDSALRLQDPFAIHAADVWRFLTSYELLVAHNAAFDLRFINREMRLSGLPALTRPVYCTMKGYRALDLGGSASLSAVCRHIKLARAGDLHGAIEDAWLAMQIYLWLHGCPLQARSRGSLPRTPSNLRHAKMGPQRVDRPGPHNSMSVE